MSIDERIDDVNEKLKQWHNKYNGDCWEAGMLEETLALIAHLDEYRYMYESCNK